MVIKRSEFIRNTAVCVWLALLVFGLLGCTSAGNRYNSALDLAGPFQIIPVRINSTVMLSPDDIIRIMRASDFNDQQIYDLGQDLRDALSSAGGAKIVNAANKPRAMFKADRNTVWGASFFGGNFVYDVQRGEFGKSPRARTVPPIMPYGN